MSHAAGGERGCSSAQAAEGGPVRACPAASAAAKPPEDPPAVLRVSHGLRVAPNTLQPWPCPGWYHRARAEELVQVASGPSQRVIHACKACS